MGRETALRVVPYDDYLSRTAGVGTTSPVLRNSAVSQSPLRSSVNMVWWLLRSFVKNIIMRNYIDV